MQLEDQVAVVTGAGRGIGKAIALRLAREGADIAIVDIDAESAEATRAEVEKLGRRAVAAGVDVAEPLAVQSAISDIAGRLGRIDVLINNAGVERRADFLEISVEDWRRQIDVNLSGTFYCTQAAAREMRKASYGRIVNLASVAGLIGPIDLAAYGAAKAGIINKASSPASPSRSMAAPWPPAPTWWKSTVAGRLHRPGGDTPVTGNR